MPSGAPEVELEELRVGREDTWFPYVAFALVAGAVVGVSLAAHAFLSPLHTGHLGARHGVGWVRTFSWWDGWWYRNIARNGYLWFTPHKQSSAAFFPVYPLLMRWIGGRDGVRPYIAGFGITVAAGLGSAVLFHRWCQRRLPSSVARLGVVTLLVSPFAFYLMGAVYADALFLFFTLGAFLALEADRPWLAGLLAAVATASRPVGPALVIGLWAVAIQRKRWSPGLLLAPMGLVAYCVFLWVRFGAPFAFVDVAGAPGWGQAPGPHTWLKVTWLTSMMRQPWFDGRHGHLVINALITAAAVATLPAVFRKFGWGYGVFASAIVVAAAWSTKDFVGMGRYVLAAFPCFAAAADGLARRRASVRWLALGASAVALLMLAQLHARGTIIS